MTAATDSAATNQTDSATRRLGLVLQPLDVLFVGDGRPVGGALRGHSRSTPLPQTVAGAVWTALLDLHGCDFARLSQQVQRHGLSFEQALDEQGLPTWIARVAVRGPWLARRHVGSAGGSRPAASESSDVAAAGGTPNEPAESLEVFVPAPAVLHRRKKSKGLNGQGRSDEPLLCLRPLKEGLSLPGWGRTPSAGRLGLRPLWLAGGDQTERAVGLLNLQGLERFLRGEPVRAGELVEQNELVGFDHRTGIAIDASTLTARESQLYTSSYLTLAWTSEWQAVLYVELTVPPEGEAAVGRLRTLRLGGESRCVAVQTCQPVRWPDVEPSDGERWLVVLTTPGLFELGWKPKRLEGRLVAAAVPEGFGVSGWDLARGGPKPARFAVPAGSVYFLDGPATGLPDSLADQPLDRQQGWGCYVRGVWRDG